jgi:hypothetical protein
MNSRSSAPGAVLASLLVAGLGAGPAGGDVVGADARSGAEGPIAFAGVSVTLDGGGTAGGTVTGRVPADCWWERVPIGTRLPGDPPLDAADPATVAAAVERVQRRLLDLTAPHVDTALYHVFAAEGLPPEAQIRDVVLRTAAGADISWYAPRCVPGRDPLGTGLLDPFRSYLGVPIARSFQPFAAGEVPPPAVHPLTLAEVAREALPVEAPAVDRNPRIPGQDATLVHLPTWFWVTNGQPAVAAATGGVRTATAVAARGAAGPPVTATVRADVGRGLTITSPAGDTVCSPARAVVRWSPTADENAACTLTFRRASVGRPGGWPVELATTWSVTWTGVTADGVEVGGELAPLTRSTDVLVPVAEAQAVVRAP